MSQSHDGSPEGPTEGPAAGTAEAWRAIDLTAVPLPYLDPVEPAHAHAWLARGGS